MFRQTSILEITAAIETMLSSMAADRVGRIRGTLMRYVADAREADFGSQSAGLSLLCGRFHRQSDLKCLFARNDHPSTKFVILPLEPRAFARDTFQSGFRCCDVSLQI